MGDVGVEHIAAMLKSNTTIESLYLGGVGMGDAGAFALAAVLTSNKTVKHLDISRNVALKAAGISRLAEMLKMNKFIETFYVTECGSSFDFHGCSHSVDFDSLSALVAALSENTTIVRLKCYAGSVHGLASEFHDKAKAKAFWALIDKSEALLERNRLIAQARAAAQSQAQSEVEALRAQLAAMKAQVAGREAENARLQQAAAAASAAAASAAAAAAAATGASVPRLPWPSVQAVIDGGDRLGGGAFGAVFRGRLDVGAGLREVAVKLIVVGGGGPQATSDDRFRGEVFTLCSLRHPHLLWCAVFLFKFGKRAWLNCPPHSLGHCLASAFPFLGPNDPPSLPHTLTPNNATPQLSGVLGGGPRARAGADHGAGGRRHAQRGAPGNERVARAPAGDTRGGGGALGGSFKG